MIAQPHVEIDVGFVLTLGDPPEGGEDELDEIAHQPGSLFAGGRGFQGRLETGGIPARGKLAPARSTRCGLFPWFRSSKNFSSPSRWRCWAGVLEDLVGQVDAWQRSTGVKLHHVIDVAAQDRRFHVPGTDHVIRHEQELLVLNPRVLGKDLRQFGHRPHGGDVLQDQVQDRHEVRLTGTEAPVQVARLAVDRIDRRLDEAQGVVEAFDQLGRDDILIERLLGLGDAFGEIENEVAFANLVPAGSAVR